LEDFISCAFFLSTEEHLTIFTNKFILQTTLYKKEVCDMNSLCCAFIMLLSTTVPDTLRTGRWIDLIGASKVWKITEGSSELLIGVIDLGFDYYHPALEGRVIPGFYAHDAYHPEIVGVSAHGTMVSSIILTLAPKCKIITASLGTIEHTLLKLQKEFFKEHPDAKMTDFQMELLKHQEELKDFGERWIRHVSKSTAEAIRFLVDRGVKVINISALLRSSEELEDAFKYAEEHDVVIVLGAGNSGQRYTDYPGDGLKNVLIVGGSTLQDERWTKKVHYYGSRILQGSNYGPRLSLLAPIESLVVAVPHEERFYHSEEGPMGPTDEEFEGPYQLLEYGGTSSAAPIVTALAALLRSLRPDLRAEEVVQLIKDGAKDLGKPGFDEETGFGRVDFSTTFELLRRYRNGG
jgi:subtilisin family serine protease